MKIFFFDWSDNIRESNRRKKIKKVEESFISRYSRRKNEKSNAIIKKESVYQITSSNESEKLISEESNFKSNSNDSNSLNNNSVSNTAIDINNNNTNINNTNNNNNNNNNNNINYDLNVIKETNEFIKDSENPEDNLRRFLNIVNEPYDYNENFIRSKKDKEKDELRKKLKEKNNNENNKNEEDKKEE